MLVEHRNSSGVLSMNAILELAESARHREILDCYKSALRMWSETKASYSKDSPEFEKAIKLVAELEQLLLQSTMKQLRESRQ